MDFRSPVLPGSCFSYYKAGAGQIVSGLYKHLQ